MDEGLSAGRWEAQGDGREVDELRGRTGLDKSQIAAYLSKRRGQRRRRPRVPSSSPNGPSSDSAGVLSSGGTSKVTSINSGAVEEPAASGFS